MINYNFNLSTEHVRNFAHANPPNWKTEIIDMKDHECDLSHTVSCYIYHELKCVVALVSLIQ